MVVLKVLTWSKKPASDSRSRCACGVRPAAVVALLWLLPSRGRVCH
jgi:hypothetical protein